MKLASLINGSLVTLWLLSLAALWVGYSWQQQAQWIGALDQYFRDRAIYQPVRRIQAIEQSWRSNGDLGEFVGSLNVLLADLQQVQKGDALDALKRDAFAALAGAYAYEENYPQLGELADAWLEFDERDLNALIWQAKAEAMQFHLMGRGLAKFEQLHHRFPESYLILDAFGSTLAQLGRLGDAFGVYSELLPGVEASGLVQSVHSPYGYAPGTSYLAQGIQADISGAEWTVSGAEWILTLAEPAGVDQIFLDLAYDMPLELEALALPPGTRIKAQGNLAQTDSRRFTKQVNQGAGLVLEGFETSVGTPLVFRFRQTLAAPQTLVNLTKPQVQEVVRSQLAANEDVSLLLKYEAAIDDLN